MSLSSRDMLLFSIASAVLLSGCGATSLNVLGPPETNRAAYEYASNLRLASALKGRLLLIHGTRDTDVPISHTMRMVDALIKARKPYDLIVLPDQPHVPTGNSWTYMRDRIAHYFQEHLKTGRGN